MLTYLCPAFTGAIIDASHDSRDGDIRQQSGSTAPADSSLPPLQDEALGLPQLDHEPNDVKPGSFSASMYHTENGYNIAISNDDDEELNDTRDRQQFINPKASYHLCPDFSIAPPPNGPLNLGSILKSLDVDDLAPLSEDSRIEVSAERIFPRHGPDIKNGFSCTLSPLGSSEFGIWAKISASIIFSWLRKRNAGETLTIKELKTTYFNPTDEYMAETLASPNVYAFIQVTKKKAPLYMITGIKAAAGASLSKNKGKVTSVTGEGGATEPHSMTQAGGKASFTSEDKAAASFESSTEFILGYRVRKIFWNEMQASDKVGGSTLEDDDKGARKAYVLTGV
ncbi:hypothetical protein V501_00446 [Pseudogymnoascus sp. VKM F-4519 (FW-2642)]|nr:hypothetical protein V501_00446 [Pseudogymnoascus sp. VKM F-4519 (FW-2642)]